MESKDVFIDPKVKRGITIGINNYNNIKSGNFMNLNFPADDSDRVRDFLKINDYTDIDQLTNEAATVEEIRYFLYDVKRDIKRYQKDGHNYHFFLYYSGHGVNTSYGACGVDPFGKLIPFEWYA